MAYNEKLVRFLVTFSMSSMNLYVKIKAANVNGIYKRLATTSTMEGPRAKASAPELDNLLRNNITPIAYTRQSTAPGYQLIQNGTQSNLPHIESQMQFYDLFHHVADWYLLTKNIIICLLRHKSLARFRYLDCFMLGRFIANGRAIELTPYCACYETLVWLTWRYMMLRHRPEFKLPCVEFLLDKQCHEPFWLRSESLEPAGECPEYHSALLEYQDPFEMYSEEQVSRNTIRRLPFKLRPNRTRTAWRELAQTTLIYYAISATILMVFLIHFLIMGLPVAITRRGFALNYRLCINWLTESSASATQPRGLFLGDQTAMFVRPKIVSTFLMPFTDLVNFNVYHILRVTLEVLETLYYYMGVAMGFNFALFITIIMSKDLICYSQSIVDRMERLAANLRWQRQELQLWDPYGPNKRQRAAVYSDWREGDHSMKMEISDIQAQISDMFTMLDSYNNYMSLQCLCFLIFWLGYTAMVSSWIFLPGNDSPKLEWYAILCAATVYLLIMLNFMTRVKITCYRLYKLITVALAIGSKGVSRERGVWISLLSFYKPRPMYCFTMLGSIELTHLSGLKLLIWLFSALLIASSFFKLHIVR